MVRQDGKPLARWVRLDDAKMQGDERMVVRPACSVVRPSARRCSANQSRD